MFVICSNCITFAPPLEKSPIVKGYRRQDKLHRNMKVMKFGGKRP